MDEGASRQAAACATTRSDLHSRLMALLEQLVHLLHSLGLLGRLAKSKVARAATPARASKVLDVSKGSDVHGHEELGRDLAFGYHGYHEAAFRRTRHVVDSLEVGAQKARGAAAIIRAIAKAKDVERLRRLRGVWVVERDGVELA